MTYQINAVSDGSTVATVQFDPYQFDMKKPSKDGVRTVLKEAPEIRQMNRVAGTQHERGTSGEELQDPSQDYTLGHIATALKPGYVVVEVPENDRRVAAEDVDKLGVAELVDEDAMDFLKEVLDKVTDSDTPKRRRDLWKAFLNRVVLRKISVQTGAAEWNPALHPRDPDTGQFVERPFDVPDDILSMDTPDLVRELAKADPDFGDKVDGLQIDMDEDLQSLVDEASSGDTVPPEVDLSRSVDTEVSDYADRITIHELDGGGTVFEKQMERLEDFPYSFPDEHLAEANRSVSGAEVMGMVGVDVPTHHFDRDEESLLVEGVDGHEIVDTSAETADSVDRDAFVEAMASSVLVGDRDIHGGNYIVGDDGVPKPIDNGYAGTELDEKKWFGMAGGATDLAEKYTDANPDDELDVSVGEIQQRAKEMAEEIDTDAVRERLERRGVPDHWTERMVQNIQFVRNADAEDTVDEPAELGAEVPDDAPEPDLRTVDTPVNRGGPRAIPEDATADDIADSFPTITERFGDELDDIEDAGVPDTNLDPDMFDTATEIMGEDLSRYKDDRLKTHVAGRISHVDGPGKRGVQSDAVKMNFPWLEGEETAEFTAINHADNAATTTVSHELQHAADNAMGYGYGGEQSGSNGGFHEYDAENPFEASSEHDKAAVDAMFKVRGTDEPIGLSDFYEDIQREVEIGPNGSPKELDPDAIQERFDEDLPDDPAAAYRRYVREVNRAFLKTQLVKNRAGEDAARDMIKLPYQMTNAGEFSAVTAEIMEDDSVSPFAVRDYVRHHPGLVAAWANMKDLQDEVEDELQKQARILGAEL